jgi:ATP synthase protein I
MSRQDETQSETPDNALQDFDRRLRAARTEAGLDRQDDAAPDRAAQSRAWGGALRAGADLIAALLVGVGLGLAVDRLAGSGPWGMLAGLFLGFAAGLRNAMRTARRLNAYDDSVR